MLNTNLASSKSGRISEKHSPSKQSLFIKSKGSKEGTKNTNVAATGQMRQDSKIIYRSPEQEAQLLRI